LNSGIKGKGAAAQANQRQSALDERGNQMLDTGMGMINNYQDQAQGFLEGGTGTGADLMNQARQGGQDLSQSLQGLAGQLQGATPTFDFQSGSNVMDQAMDTFDQFSGRARNTALEQAGLGLTSGGNALDAAMASRGISRNSGIAAGAMQDLAMQGAQQRVGLERDLANQAGQIGLQATQFDVNRQLQEQGMQSQFALGAGAQRAQNLGLAADLQTQAYATPLSMQQQMYQQNQMMPYLQMMGMSNPMDLIGMGMNTMNQGLGYAGQNAAAGGAGFGAGMSSLTGQMFDYLSNKNGG
jgi:hypothetical protein